MGRAYDIAEKIKNSSKKSTVKIDEEHEFIINTSKNTAIFIKATAEDKKIDDFKRMDTIIESGLGKEALNYINSKDYPVSVTNEIINVIMAAISDMTLEEMEELSKKEAKKFRK